MMLPLKINWIIWFVLSFITLTGYFLFMLATETYRTPLTLTPNNSIEVSIFRMHSTDLELMIDFSTKNYERRPELGHFRTSKDIHKTNTMIFENPGEPILIEVTVNDKNVLYESLPVGGRSIDINTRSLRPYEKDDDLSRFTLRLNKESYIKLPFGRANVKIKVLEVGDKIKDEKTILSIKPPVSFKVVKKGYYGFVHKFVWWPLYVFILIIYGAILLWLTKRKNNFHKPLERD